MQKIYPSKKFTQYRKSTLTGQWLFGDNQQRKANSQYSLSFRFGKYLLAVVFLTLSTLLLGAQTPPSFELKWGTRGYGEGQFLLPTGVAVDSSGNVYVVDSFLNYRIQKFDSSGTFLAEWGTRGNGNGQFSAPEGVAVDSSDNVYVADQFNYRIQKFDSNGIFLTKWGRGGSDDGQFNLPQGVTVDSSGNVYVADTSNNRIQKFDSSSNFLLKWGKNNGAGGADSDGSGDGQFNFPRGVAVDSSGNVYCGGHKQQPHSKIR